MNRKLIIKIGFAIVMIGIIYFLSITLVGAVQVSPLNGFQPKLASDITSKITMYRKTLGLSPVVGSDFICDFALIRSVEASKDFSHDGFFAKNKMYREMGIDKRITYGENIAKSYLTSNEVIQAWIDSPKHKEILESEFDNACVSCYDSYCVFNTIKY